MQAYCEDRPGISGAQMLLPDTWCKAIYPAWNEEMS